MVSICAAASSACSASPPKKTAGKAACSQSELAPQRLVLRVAFDDLARYLPEAAIAARDRAGHRVSLGDTAYGIGPKKIGIVRDQSNPERRAAQCMQLGLSRRSTRT
jgi:hypothetical protein